MWFYMSTTRMYVPCLNVYVIGSCSHRSAKQQCRMPPLVKGFLLMITWVSSLLGCMDNDRQHTWNPWKHSWIPVQKRRLEWKLPRGAAGGELLPKVGPALPLWHWKTPPFLPSVFHRTHKGFDWPHQEGLLASPPNHPSKTLRLATWWLLISHLKRSQPTHRSLPTLAQPWSLVFPGLPHPNQKWRSLIQKSWASPRAPGLAWIQNLFAWCFW